MEENRINRSIYYYEWVTHSQNKETGDVYIDKTSKKITDFLSELYEKQEECENYKDFIISTSQGEEFIIVDSNDEEQIRFRIVLCRENALPYIEKDGNITELGSVISNDQNIAEVTHCVFFVKYGILGAEYNFSGARATSVSEYMVKKTGIDSMPTCRPKLNYDAYLKLIQGETFTLFDFSVRTNSQAYNEVLSRKSIFSAIRTTVPDSDTMEVVLRKRKTKKNDGVGFVLPLSFDDIKNLLGNYREDIKKFNVSQGGMNDAVDLLMDKFIGKVTLARTINRTIDSNEMYQMIFNYFRSDVEEYCTKLEG